MAYLRLDLLCRFFGNILLDKNMNIRFRDINTTKIVKNTGIENSLYNIGNPLKILINDLSNIESTTIDSAMANATLVSSRINNLDNRLDTVFI